MILDLMVFKKKLLKTLKLLNFKKISFNGIQNILGSCHFMLNNEKTDSSVLLFLSNSLHSI